MHFVTNIQTRPRAGVSACYKLKITEEQKRELNRWLRAPSTPQGMAWKATVILLASEGIPNNQISTRTGVSRPTILMWRNRFEKGGIKKLTTLERGRGRKRIIPAKKCDALEHTNDGEAPWGEPHRSRRCVKGSQFETPFGEKLKAVVGLYLNPPENELVFCVDEKSQIQELDRTQASLPLKKGRAGTMTHD